MLKNVLIMLIAIAACGGGKPASPTSTPTGATSADAACTPDQCGNKPMLFQRCPDGSGVGADRCERGPNGCGWQMQQCPTEPAAAPTGAGVGTATAGPGECTCQGDKPNMMALCPDGKNTISATGKCIATKDGCAWEMTKCP